MSEGQIRSLELAHAGHTSSLEEIISNLKETVGELRKELAAQREITLQLERNVARMGYQHSA